METTDKERTTLQIARDHVRPLIDRFGMVRNELFGLMDLPGPSGPADSDALAWWQKKSDEEQYTLRAALAAIASPALIADTAVNIRNERLIFTHAVLPSIRWNDPAFLVAADADGKQLQVEYLQKADLFTNTLFLYLESGVPAYTMEMKFEIPVSDFAVLLAAVDLRQRVRYRALLDHAPFPAVFAEGDIAGAFTGGVAVPDPRWLLPFVLPALHLKEAALVPSLVRESLARLAGAGLLKVEGGQVAFTEPGEKFAESAGGRISCIRFDLFGVSSSGTPGRQSVLLIRGEHLLWYAGVNGKNGETVVVTPVTLDQAGQLLQELFTPVAVPKPVEPGGADASPKVAPAAAPAPTGKKEAAGKKFCPSCGKPLKPGLKFCSSCGAKIT